MAFLRALLFAFAMASANAVAADRIWTASEKNGDKPGIGLRLVQTAAGITGDAYLLDPDHPHDFSHGAKRKMNVTQSSDREVRFNLDWGDGKQRSYVLRFEIPLKAKPVRGTMTEENESGAPSIYTFTPSKLK